MLNGERVRLRMVREDDLEALYAHNARLDARGPFYILDVASLSTLRRRFAENGLWDDDSGTLLIVDHADVLLGAMFFFRRVTYHHWDSFELAYRLFDPAMHGKGVMTEALRLISDYLFASQRVNRLEIVAFPDNAASIRVAEKSGYRHEGVARGAFLHHGQARDVVVMARLRNDPAEPG